MQVSWIDVQGRELRPPRIALEINSGNDAVVTWDNERILAAEEQVGSWDRYTGAAVDPELFEAADADAGTAMHPDGRLAALSERDLIEIIDLTTGDLVARIDHDDALAESLPLFPIVFSPDGRWLAAATSSGRVVVWDTQSWKQYRTWPAVPGFGINSMTFTPEADFLVTGGAGTAAIWNVQQGLSGGVRLEVDPGRPDANVLVGVQDGGRTLVTYTEGTGVREWDVSPAGLLEHACMVAGRNFTRDEWNDVLPDRPYERTCPQYPAG